jgi:two-component system chemotaxis response regulator CheY
MFIPLHVFQERRGRMNVLVLDDSKAMRTILKKILESMGAEVQEAANSQEGLRILEGNPRLDLVLVDWNMPGMNGLEFIRAVRANPHFHNVVLMMVTAEIEQSQIGKALTEGANEYVMKPFTKEVIQDKMKILGLHAEMTKTT